MPNKTTESTVFCSIANFSHNIDNYKNINDKIDYATNYLLSFKDSEDATLAEAINIARMKVLDAIEQYKVLEKKSEQIKKAINAFPDDDLKEIDLKEYGQIKDNPKLDYFLSDPCSYLRIVSSKKIEKKENEDLLFQKDVNNLENYKALNKRFDKLNVNVDKKELNHLHINARLKEKFGGLKQLNKAVNKTKMTFFQKIFRSISPEGENLLNSYKEFNNPNSKLYGNKDNLEEAANSYLKHIFPKWEPGYPLPDNSRINSLSGTQKDRVLLCNGILESVRKEKQIEDIYDDATNINSVIDPSSVFETTTVVKHHIIDLDKDLDESLYDKDELEENNNEIKVNNDLQM